MGWQYGVRWHAAYEKSIVVLPQIQDSELTWEASEMKAAYPIPYADCFAAATALRFETPILTGDPEFKKIASIVPLEWL